MSSALSAAPLRAILLDIEGTTTPIDFVYQVLFPFARAHAREYLEQHIGSEDLRADLMLLKKEYEADVTQELDPPRWVDEPLEDRLDSITATIHGLMDRDRKSTGLKSLQGKIWQQGYATGTLKGEVFPDVPPALERWRQSGIDACIFSSGSVLAQKLLFSSTAAGDLTRYLREFFDTTTGPKTSEESYRRIAAELRLPASAILFISDVTAELDAAMSAGMRTLLCVRPGNRPQPAGHGHTVIENFDQVVL